MRSSYHSDILLWLYMMKIKRKQQANVNSAILYLKQL
jgi:hypothetical protein